MCALYRPPVPSESFEHRVSINATRATAWAHLQEATTWEALAGIERIHNVVHDADGHLVSYEFDAIAGGKRYPGTARVIERKNPERMVLRIDSSEIDGDITTTLADDHPLELTVGLRLRSKGLLSTMFFPVVAASVGSGFPRQVDEFAARVAAS